MCSEVVEVIAYGTITFVVISVIVLIIILREVMKGGK
jgi:hypothetical protein